MVCFQTGTSKNAVFFLFIGHRIFIHTAPAWRQTGFSLVTYLNAYNKTLTLLNI